MDFNFAEYYKRLSNTELFDMLDNAAAYQPSAIDAANNELNQRRLSESEIEEARIPLMVTQLRKEEKIEKDKMLETKMKTVSESIFNSVKSHDTKEGITNKIILFVIILNGINFIKSLPTFYRIFKDIFENFSDYPLRSLIFFLPEILMPIALIIFWKRKSIGWTLLTSYVTFTVVCSLLLIYENFKVMPYRSYRGLHASPVSATVLFELFILLCTLCVLCTNDIRLVYKIDIPKMSGIIFISTVLSFIIIWSNL